MSNEWTLLDESRECAAQDPLKALKLVSSYIAAHPEDGRGYFSRHLIWKNLKEYGRSMDDCMMAIRIDPKPNRLLARGELFREMGDHASAIDDFSYVHDLDFEDWLELHGPHFRADSLARLGRLEEALADCELIDNDHWWPAHCGLPGGNKDQFIAEIRRRAALAQAGKLIDK